MKAFAITARDTQPAVQDVPQPEPAPDEVLVEVEAASVNGFDLSVAAGYVWDMIPHEFPVVLGRDLVGTVTAVEAGVDSVSVGDRVAGVIPGMAPSAPATAASPSTSRCPRPPSPPCPPASTRRRPPSSAWRAWPRTTRSRR